MKKNIEHALKRRASQHCCMLKKFRKFEFKTFNDRGYKLTPVELKDAVPFEVKRVYFVREFEKEAQTGEHIHKIEEEVFLQVKGRSIAVIDRGAGKEEMEMSAPGDAIYVPAFVWHGFKNASPDCVIAAFSSTNYNPTRADYVEDYEEFKKISPYYKK